MCSNWLIKMVLELEDGDIWLSPAHLYSYSSSIPFRVTSFNECMGSTSRFVRVLQATILKQMTHHNWRITLCFFVFMDFYKRFSMLREYYFHSFTFTFFLQCKLQDFIIIYNKFILIHMIIFYIIYFFIILIIILSETNK